MIQRRHFAVNARGRNLHLGEETCVMGILNCSPDSFSGDGVKSLRKGFKQAQDMIINGAHILDIGGQSTRPQAPSVSPELEVKRILPLIERVSKELPCIISVDTFYSDVAAQALQAGAHWINTVRGARFDRALIKVVKKYDAGLVLMHSRGDAMTMMTLNDYDDLMADIKDELNLVIKKCLDLGIKKDRIIVDPGIGFAKSSEQNLLLIKSLGQWRRWGWPILVGPSRKSFIGRVLNKDPQDRLWGTAAAVSACIMNGAHIIRVHDVEAMRDVAKVTDAICQSKIS